ncbi:hypothetical protein [Streptomyces sp. NPDC013489]|uniref:hypothetical protein n=1 Tax=Streptomyces sp. NPDC013489 TaxID=3155606 RepID=UPI0033C95FB7
MHVSLLASSSPISRAERRTTACLASDHEGVHSGSRPLRPWRSPSPQELVREAARPVAAPHGAASRTTGPGGPREGGRPVRANAEVLALGSHWYPVGFAIGAWAIPLAMWWLPRRIALGIHRAGGPAST